MNSGNPMLSIITINFNNIVGLQKTMESVFPQSFTNFEYVLIDGGSTDGSKEIIESNSDKLNYWVSEKDNGIYNAMNKGIAKAKGEYLLFLNSGDYLVNRNVLDEVFSEDRSSDIIYGNLQTETSILRYPETLDFSYFFRDSIGHAGAFIKRTLFQKAGLYNEANRLVSDWEFFLKAIVLHKASYQYINKTISFFNSDGASNNIENYNIHMKERVVVLEPLLKEYYPQLLQNINCLHDELYLFRNSRAVKFLKKAMDYKIIKLFKR